jgi:hypothetical protein
MALVALFVLRDFGLPILGVSFGQSCASAAGMTMPETAVHEYNLGASWKDQIRCTWEIASIQTKPITEAMGKGTNEQFGLGILRLHLAHDPTALCWREHIDSRSQ